MSTQRHGKIVLKMDQMRRLADLRGGLRRAGKETLRMLGIRASIIATAIVVLLLAATGGWFATKAYMGSRGSKPPMAIVVKTQRGGTPQTRSTQMSLAILLLLASSGCLIGVIARRKRNLTTGQERMAAALSRALESKVLEPVTAASKRAHGRVAYPQVKRALLCISPVSMPPTEHQTFAEPTMALKCFVPVLPSNIGLLSLGEGMEDHLREVTMVPETREAVLIGSVESEQVSSPGGPPLDRRRYSSGLQDIIAELNKSRASLAMAQERIQQTSARIRNRRNGAAMPFEESALVA